MKIDSDISNNEIAPIGNLRYVIFEDADDINLTGDGQDYAAELELIYRFQPALLRDYAVADAADRGGHS